MTESRSTLRNGVLCACVFAVCLLIAWPVAEMGFIDDWSYIRSAQVFAQTGHLVYNGWATAMLGWQVAWGALFIRLFGFSFMVVKLSTLPLALATIILFHSILIRFGLNPRNAVLGTLTLGLSPLFLPLAASYMTDIPGLFVIILCLYCCQRAVSARTHQTAIAWLCLAAASNVVGGSARQIAWLGVLVMVPSTGWLLRNRRGVLPAAILLWIAGIASVFSFITWFAHQPYSVPDHPLKASRMEHPFSILLVCIDFVGALLLLSLVVLPVLLPWLSQIRKAAAAALAAVAFVFVLWAVAPMWNLPWIPHMIFSEFATARNASMNPPNTALFILSVPIRLLVSLLVVSAAAVFAAAVRIKQRELKCSSAFPFGREFFWLLIPFTLSYFTILTPRAGHGMVFDRYMLCVMPVAIVYMIRLHQQWIAPRLPAYSVVALILYALSAIAGTHDWFAWQRARLKAVEEIQAAGVPRNKIQGGFEYDGWTQIENGGNINFERIEIPAGSYRPDAGTPQLPADCKLDFASFTPDVHPIYTVAFGPKACLSPSEFPSVHYSNWLPPFQKTIYIQKIPSPAPAASLPSR